MRTKTLAGFALGSGLAAAAGCVAVAGDPIRASDLAGALPALAASSATLGPGPAPGAIRRFSARELARLTGVEMETGVCVERKTAPLEAELVTTALRASLPHAELELLDFARAPMPSGELEFPVSGLSPTGLWRGRLRYAAARTLPVWARVRASERRPVVVAAGSLLPGRPIEEEQVRVEWRQMHPASPPSLARVSEVVGKLPRRLLRAGEPLGSGLLMTGYEVARGDTVTVQSESGAARVEFEARAESSGRAGEAVLVKSPINGRRLRARVLRKGVVRL